MYLASILRNRSIVKQKMFSGFTQCLIIGFLMQHLSNTIHAIDIFLWEYIAYIGVNFTPVETLIDK